MSEAAVDSHTWSILLTAWSGSLYAARSAVLRAPALVPKSTIRSSSPASRSRGTRTDRIPASYAPRAPAPAVTIAVVPTVYLLRWGWSHAIGILESRQDPYPSGKVNDSSECGPDHFFGPVHMATVIAW